MQQLENVRPLNSHGIAVEGTAGTCSMQSNILPCNPIWALREQKGRRRVALGLQRCALCFPSSNLRLVVLALSPQEAGPCCCYSYTRHPSQAARMSLEKYERLEKIGEGESPSLSPLSLPRVAPSARTRAGASHLETSQTWSRRRWTGSVARKSPRGVATGQGWLTALSPALLPPVLHPTSLWT